jgi:hypothetical protein
VVSEAFDPDTNSFIDTQSHHMKEAAHLDLSNGTGFATLSPRTVASGEITFPCSGKGNCSLHRSPASGDVLTEGVCADAARIWDPD